MNYRVVSWNRGTPMSSMSIRFFIIIQPFLGTLICGKPLMLFFFSADMVDDKGNKGFIVRQDITNMCHVPWLYFLVAHIHVKKQGKLWSLLSLQSFVCYPLAIQQSYGWNHHFKVRYKSSIHKLPIYTIFQTVRIYRESRRNIWTTWPLGQIPDL